LSLCLLCSCTGLVGGGADDAGPFTDAGLADAGVADAGLVDAGAVDAGTPDAGAPDAGTWRPVYVIGGQDMRTMVSFDGKTWLYDQYVAPNGEDNSFFGVAVGAGALLVAGDPGVYRSTDGQTWSLALARPSRFAFHGAKVLFAHDVFVMVSGDMAWRSPDGLTWESAADAGASGHWASLAYGNGHWVAFGDGHRKASEDGLTWHDYTATADPDPFEAVAFGNDVFVAVGQKNNAARIATSPDGVTWTEQAPVATSYSTGFGAIAFGDGRFVASDCCNAFESPDGVSWSKRGRGAQSTLAFAGGRFVGAGWRTTAVLYDQDAGAFSTTFSGDQPDQYLTDGGLWPWFTGFGAGMIPGP
jgi:hypothetical protein